LAFFESGYRIFGEDVVFVGFHRSFFVYDTVEHHCKSDDRHIGSHKNIHIFAPVKMFEAPSLVLFLAGKLF
jgi:hypothetical protein